VWAEQAVTANWFEQICAEVGLVHAALNLPLPASR
jgi:hypothetical protein